MTDPTPSGFMQHDDDYEPNVPNLAKRAPERKGKPRLATEADLSARMAQIVDEIVARDGQTLSEIRYRGKGRR